MVRDLPALAAILSVAVDRALPIISVYAVNSPPRISLTMANTAVKGKARTPLSQYVEVLSWLLLFGHHNGITCG
jgi:hypothetical protein